MRYQSACVRDEDPLSKKQGNRLISQAIRDVRQPSRGLPPAPILGRRMDNHAKAKLVRLDPSIN